MVPDNVITVLVQENLDIACSAIEKAAMERAIADVDEGFAQSYEARRRHREIRAGQPFWDPAAPPSTFTSVLPDALRIKPSGVQPHQALVYEDFSESPFQCITFVYQRATDALAYPPRTDSRASSTPFNPAGLYAHSPSLDQIVSLRSHQEVMERFTVCSLITLAMFF